MFPDYKIHCRDNPPLKECCDKDETDAIFVFLNVQFKIIEYV